MSAEEPLRTRVEDDEPDPRLLWRWVGRAVRPYVGWILIGAGALVMLIGWFGVSRDALPGKQIPYLVSGGIGGVFLAVLGAYFLGTQEMRNDSGRLDRLEHMVEELHAALLERPDAPAPAAASAAAAPVPDGANDGSAGSNGSFAPARRVVLVVDHGETFHRPGCSMVADKDTHELTLALARRRGLRPCPLCSPAPAGVT